MRAILNCSAPDNHWDQEYFDTMSVYMLPVLGKPIIEYYMEYCVLAGAKSVLVLLQDYDEELVKFLGAGTKWGISIEIGTASAGDNKDSTLKKNSHFLDGSEILFLDGFFLPLCFKAVQEENSSENIVPDLSLLQPYKDGLQRISLISETGNLPYSCESLEIRSILEFYNLNMLLLKSFNRFIFMRGYAVQSDVFMGMNNAITRGANLNPPLIIGDNVHIEAGVKAGPNSIIGDTAIVDKSTHLEDVIVFGKTYIGTDLELKKKILMGQYIIDPEVGVKLMFCDSFFTSPVDTGSAKTVFARIYESIFAFVLLLPLLVFYIPFLFLGRPPSKMVKFATPLGAVVSVKKYLRTSKLRNIWFFKMSLDKVPRLIAVMLGKMSLVGDSLQPSEDDGEFRMHYKIYSPGAYTYADSLGKRTTYDKFIDDLYYRHGKTFKTDLQVILRTYITRIFGDQSK